MLDINIFQNPLNLQTADILPRHIPQWLGDEKRKDGRKAAAASQPRQESAIGRAVRPVRERATGNGVQEPPYRR